MGMGGVDEKTMMICLKYTNAEVNLGHLFLTSTTNMQLSNTVKWRVGNDRLVLKMVTFENFKELQIKRCKYRLQSKEITRLRVNNA